MYWQHYLQRHCQHISDDDGVTTGEFIKFTRGSPNESTG